MSAVLPECLAALGARGVSSKGGGGNFFQKARPEIFDEKLDVQAFARRCLLTVSDDCQQGAGLSIAYAILCAAGSVLSASDHPFCIPGHPLSEAENPLGAAHHPFSITGNPLSVTENTLSEIGKSILRHAQFLLHAGQSSVRAGECFVRRAKYFVRDGQGIVRRRKNGISGEKSLVCHAKYRLANKASHFRRIRANFKTNQNSTQPIAH